MGSVFISFVNGVMGSLRGFRGDIEAVRVLNMGSRHNFFALLSAEYKEVQSMYYQQVIKNIKHVDVIRKLYIRLNFNWLYMASSLSVILP